MANQYSRRDWKQELVETAGRLKMCVVLPKHLTANTRVRCSCPHGVVKETTVLRFVERQFCCKSQASRAHDPEQKRLAAKARWSNPFAKNPPQTVQSNQKRSKTLTNTLKVKKAEGWVNPGWGRKPPASERILPGTLYLVRYLDKSGTHFKLGITKLTLRERLGDHLISIIQTWNFPLGKCFDLEQATLRYAAEHGHRYSSPTTTELIRPEGILPILEFIEHSLDDDGYVAQS
jgi:hypothetical protein